MKTLNITKPIISIFASGLSINSLSLQQIEDIHNNSYTFFLNYAPCKFDDRHIDCLMWSDKCVTKWLDEYYKEKPKYTLLTRQTAFHPTIKYNIKDWINHWFYLPEERLKGRYTLVWLLQLLQLYYPNIPIYLYGHDCNGNGKWYDEYIQTDIIKRGNNFNIIKKTIECDVEIKKYVSIQTIKQIKNCNLNSKSILFKNNINNNIQE
jgi:hypothetical protein